MSRASSKKRSLGTAIPLVWIAQAALIIATATPSPALQNDSPTANEVQLRQTYFFFPGSGERNNNHSIGPFCCTGETATITSGDGQPLGYIYFFGWKGQAYNLKDTSAAPSVEILVSGLADLSNPCSPMKQASLVFQPGETRKTVRAGGLSFEVSIEAQSLLLNNKRYFDMSSVHAAADVSPAPKPDPPASSQAGEKPRAEEPATDPFAGNGQEQRLTSFAFPGGGERNNNHSIGPFCCTGETATIRSANGQPLGYIYFFSWQGQAYNCNEGSRVPSVEILVSGLADLSNPDSRMEKTSVLFHPKAGTRKTVRAGGLSFDVSLEAQSPCHAEGYFDMKSIKAWVDVSR